MVPISFYLYQKISKNKIPTENVCHHCPDQQQLPSLPIRDCQTLRRRVRSPTQDVWLKLGFLIFTHWLSLRTPQDHLRGTSCVLCYVTCFCFLVEFQGWHLTQDIIPVVGKEAQRRKSYKDTQRAA